MDPFFLPEQYSLIWYSSWQPLVTGSYAFYKGHSDFAALSYLVFLTSLNYWRYPVPNSWRRALDVACVQMALWYHLVSAYLYGWIGANEWPSRVQMTGAAAIILANLVLVARSR